LEDRGIHGDFGTFPLRDVRGGLFEFSDAGRASVRGCLRPDRSACNLWWRAGDKASGTLAVVRPRAHFVGGV